MAAFTFNKDDVTAICKQYPQAFGGDDATIDARRRLLMPIICRAARKKDGPVWFLINRLDRQDDDPRPGRLTSDVIWHKPSNNHIDVLSAKGGMWEEHGPVTDPDWVAEHPDNWPSWDDVTPVPEPPPSTPPPLPPLPPPPPPPPHPAPFDRLARLEQQILAIHDATRP